MLLFRFVSWSFEFVSDDELKFTATSSWNRRFFFFKCDSENWKITSHDWVVRTLVVSPLIRSLLLPRTDKNFDLRKLGVRSIRIFTFPSRFLCVASGRLLSCKSTISMLVRMCYALCAILCKQCIYWFQTKLSCVKLKRIVRDLVFFGSAKNSKLSRALHAMKMLYTFMNITIIDPIRLIVYHRFHCLHMCRTHFDVKPK